jgi:arylsulfatase A-like enzyme
MDEPRWFLQIDWMKPNRLDQAGRAAVAGLLVLCWLVSAAAPSESPPGAPPPARAPAPRRPNIVFILADDLGYGDVGCYGQTRIKTPNLDKLAADGIRFTSFYAGSTVCAPSRATLMTGLHSGHNIVRGNRRNAGLRQQDLTVAELLKQAGYRTALVGKWGLGEEGSPGVPGKKGFDEFIGYLNQTHAHDYYTDHLFRVDPVTGFEGRITLMENAGGQKGLYIDDLFTRAALKFIENNQPDDLNRHRPFFLYLTYTIPHANNEEGVRSGNGMEVPTDAPYSAESWPPVQKNKAAMITRMDNDIGRILERLKALKLEQNTLIFFSSDNGPHKEGGVDPEFFKSSGPFRGIKRDLYEGGIRVPFIVRWPGKIQAGRVSDEPYAFWDFLPTAAEIALVKAPSEIDGVSLLPALLGKAQTPKHEFLYWEFHERGFQQAVRMGDWKAVRPQAGEPLELYALKADPGESKNVAAQNPEVIAKIEGLLKTARADSPLWPIQSEPPPAKKKKKAD